MQTKIIACLNQKGGPGKSTICMHIAGTLGLRGFDVLVVDADKQGTAQSWATAAPEERGRLTHEGRRQFPDRHLL